MSDKMIQGLYVNEPHENAPEFIKCCLSVQVEQFIEWLREQEPTPKGYIKLDIKRSKAGKLYASLNEYTGPKDVASTDEKDDLPF